MTNHYSGKIYLTAAGLEKFKKEYEKLRKIRSSKNNDQEELININQKIEEIELILKNFELIKIPPKNKQHLIDLGATVVVEINGQIDEFTVVGTLEANPALGKISNESPLGQAFLNHKVGDEVVIKFTTKTIYKIKKINYKIN